MVKLTQSALDKLKDELNQRIENREKIAEEIAIAHEMGDLRENAAYDEAKDKQGLNEARIRELEELIKDAELVEEVHSNDEIGIGSIVLLKLLDNNMEMEFQIVSFNEANPSERKISDQSPLSQALINKRKDDIIEVESPNGVKKYQILNIK